MFFCKNIETWNLPLYRPFNIEVLFGEVGAIEKLLKNSMFGTLFALPFFVSLFFRIFFWGWLVFGTYNLLFGVYCILLAIVSQMETVRSRGMRILFRSVVIVAGSSLVLLFVLVFLPSYYDISHYVKRDFKYAVGQLNAVSQAKTTKGFGLWEEIRIRNTTYISPVSITNTALDPMIMIEYLPHSRFITQYWSEQSAPEH